MNKINVLKTIAITFLVGVLLYFGGLVIKSYLYPNESYMVYIDGKKIGLIKNKQELLDKINNEQSAIKDKYNVDTVYPPNGLKIVKYMTYRDNYLSINEVYNLIDDFTIKGYTVTISGEEEEKVIYTLDKEPLENALDKLVSIFVPEEQYQKYLNDTQEKIADEGEYINDVYIQEKVIIKEGYISTSNQILTSYEEISRYLLYGTTTIEKEYTVQKGDTIESIAYDNGLSVEEFLIANPKLHKDELLSGNGDQKVNVQVVNPILGIVYETDLVENQVDEYNTITKYDANMAIGTSYTQPGENGIIKVKFQMQYLNGEIYQVRKISSSEITPAIDKVVVRGGYKVTGGNSGAWYWPTIKPYKISSTWGYRWGSFHDAIDISGCGHGSPIYAANDGVVLFAGRSSDGAIVVRLDHKNGYFTNYVHLKETNVSTGQTVSAGQPIAKMGNTGYVVPKPTAANPYAGTHLHFSVYYSSDGGATKKTINPLTLKYQ